MVYRTGHLYRVKSRQKEASQRWAQAVGDAVRARRGELQISQERLGYAAKLDRTYISGVERGVKNPTIQTLRKLARALECRPSELLARAEQLNPLG